MTDNEIMEDWKKSSIVIGSPTNIPATLTSLIPVTWLCITYNYWPSISTVLTVWGVAAASFGAFYFVRPVSYYAALSTTGTYLSFLSGNIGNIRVPCAALALNMTHSTPGTIQTEVVPTMTICGSVITNLTGTTSAVIVGDVVLFMLPELIVVGLTKYASSTIFGATFGSFAVKYPKVAVFALAIPIILKMTTGLPAAAITACTVSGTLSITRVFYRKGLVK